MKKKIALLASALFVFASVEAFSFGIGLRGNFGYGYGGSLLFSPNKTLHFGLSYYLGNELHLGLTADKWFVEKELTSVGSGSLDFYVGIGLYGWLVLAKDPWMGLGLRVPIGLDLSIDWFELFLEAAPQIGFSLLPSVGLGGDWFNAALGFRVWID
ncbi:MAG: hypothetical protein LBH18_02635 [Spirochaetaceae bacterium]|jgi:hypothetical protein|nr:hypothetical protein [Spirochaetaceae bacterium]